MRKTLLSLLFVVSTTLSATVTITMEQEAGVYKIPCVVNGLRMKFIFDTGATSVCISQNMANFMYENDYITDSDIEDIGNTRLGNGEIVEHVKIKLREVEIGGLKLKDVEAIVVRGQDAPLLLGQSVIQRLGTISISGNMLTIHDYSVNLEDVDVAIKCFMYKAEFEGVPFEGVTLELFREILSDTNKDRLHNFYTYVVKNHPFVYEEKWHKLNWNQFVEEVDKLIHLRENKLVSQEEFVDWKISDLQRKAVVFADQKEYDLAAETYISSYYLELSGGDAYSDALKCIHERIIGEYYFQAKDYSKAINWLDLSSEHGDMEAQFFLGQMYFNGDGVEQNYSKAILYYRKAADNNHAGAQCNLGHCYYNGYGVAKNIDEGFKWTCIAYKNGDKTAASNLIGYYNDYMSMAKRGNGVAAFYLGLCYHEGYGTLKDYVEAQKWYKFAAERGDVAGMNNLASMYQNGEGSEIDMVSAIYWYRQAAEKGNATSQRNLGDLYFYGDFVECDYLVAYKWYIRAAEQGDTWAMCGLAIMLINGNGVKRDLSRAVSYLQEAVSKECDEAYYVLGNLYWQGIGVENNCKKAIELWSNCSKENCDSHGIDYLIANAYRDGKGVKKDIEMYNTYKYYYTKATDGLNELAYDFAEGRYGWKKQLSQAFVIINEAIKINPQNPDYYDTKGEFYSMQNNYEKAKEMWLKVKSLDASYYSENNTELNKYIQKH